MLFSFLGKSSAPLPSIPHARRYLVAGTFMILLPGLHAEAEAPPRMLARAAIHPTLDAAGMQRWLARVPETRAFPPDFEETLKGKGSLYIIEMATVLSCIPCADLWKQLAILRAIWLAAAHALGRRRVAGSVRLGLP